MLENTNQPVLFYALPFILALLFSYLITPLIRKVAFKWHILDIPGEPRKIHDSPMPLLGGWAVIISFLVVAIVMWSFGWLTDAKINNFQIVAIGVATLLIALGGILDDKYKIRPVWQFIWPALAALVVVIFGIKVGYVTNPFSAGTGPYGRSLFYFVPVAGSIFSFLWLLGMMYTVKLLDGLDGLVTGVGAIGAVILFVVSLFWDIPLSGTSVLALILAGSCLGFLPSNWQPAKIFLGESGSLFIGFMLGVLSIISGAKLATALLIIGIPILDVIWVIVRRLFKEKHSPFLADRKHLHFRLLDIGLSQRQTVIFLYFLTAFFGTISIFLQSQQKILALVVLVVIMLLLTIIIINKYRRQPQRLNLDEQ
jgi:UDP-GlcNAc:undecaprenyl-phosphate/decaprenyl-phosphate GlcNAc-1-phosphate transferase